ncbi:MAG: PA0069 family radical SAM protein [Gammaproteobacteria bacterium]|nr:PA0069 family radical SAM protein [Gammaproteobacteria bacterium]NNC76573.1 PA0069 family radical SAM protein [Woeseiaceae bacterium]
MRVRQHKGRGAVSDRDGRFVSRPVKFDDEELAARAENAPHTELRAMRAGRIIATNSSPDIPFNRSINPYQGCEHGCIYCYARPSHSYLDLSPGLDFETKIFYKPNAPARLSAEWEKPGYQCEPITIGANTDPYQPAEKKTGVTRELLMLFCKHKHPVNIITKSNLILRDIELLAELSDRRLCSVALSLPTMDRALKRIMEPRVPSVESRLRTIERLASRGVPVSVLVAPLIPAINDNEIESILEAVADAGATQAHYIFLRLPHEVRDLFIEWLDVHFPDRAEHVMSLVRQASGGRDYDPSFGVRQSGRGPYAELLAGRFRNACRRLGLQRERYQQPLDCNQFERPGQRQLGLDL